MAIRSGPARFTRHTSGGQAAGGEVSEPSNNKTLKIISVIFLYLNLSAFICVNLPAIWQAGLWLNSYVF